MYIFKWTFIFYDNKRKWKCTFLYGAISFIVITIRDNNLCILTTGMKKIKNELRNILTMDVQMKPCSVLVSRRPVEEHNFTGVPTLVGLLYVSQVERSKTIWRVWRDSSHSAFVSRTAVSGVVVVPYEYRYVKTLKRRKSR